jgi:hypothetical protein
MRDIRGEASGICGGGDGLPFLSSIRGQPLSVLLQLECRMSGNAKTLLPPLPLPNNGLPLWGGVKLNVPLPLQSKLSLLAFLAWAALLVEDIESPLPLGHISRWPELYGAASLDLPGDGEEQNG